MGNLSAAVSSKPSTKESSSKENETDSPNQPERQKSVSAVQVQPLDDVTFKLNEKNDATSLLQKVQHAISI